MTFNHVQLYSNVDHLNVGVYFVNIKNTVQLTSGVAGAGRLRLLGERNKIKGEPNESQQLFEVLKK